MLKVYCASIYICILFTSSVCCRAEEKTTKPNFWSIGVTAGTLGAGLEASFLLYDSLVLRANATYASLGYSVDAKTSGDGSIDMDFGLAGMTAGVIMDFHPFRAGWRLSGGFRYVDIKCDATTGITYTVETDNLTLERTGTLEASIRSRRSAAPYLGVGYDSSHFSTDGAGFRLGIDLGALYAGAPDVSVRASNQDAALVADAASAAASIRENLDKYYKFYPVVMLSGRISF